MNIPGWELQGMEKIPRQSPSRAWSCGVTFPRDQETPGQLPQEREIGKTPHSLSSSFPGAGIKRDFSQREQNPWISQSDAAPAAPPSLWDLQGHKPGQNKDFSSVLDSLWRLFPTHCWFFIAAKEVSQCLDKIWPGPQWSH